MNKFIPLIVLAAAASASAASLNATDTGFLAKAVRGNTFEIEAAKLALRMSHSATNRAFARQMIADHTKLGAQVKAAIMRADPSMKLPTTVTYKQWDMLQALRASGRSFDRMYRTDMISSHRETYNLFNQYSHSRYANRGLQRVIMGAKPVVHMHWKHAYNLAR